jgi:Arc/MetJ family transcription regulator
MKGVHYTHRSGEEDVMRTNIVIDEKLIREAMKATGLKTKRAVVEAGLQALIQIKSQADIRRWRGQVQWEGDLDELRRSRVPEK